MLLVLKQESERDDSLFSDSWPTSFFALIFEIKKWAEKYWKKREKKIGAECLADNDDEERETALSTRR